MASPAIVGVKFSLMPNSLKMTDTWPGDPGHHRNREFASGEEACLVTVVGNQFGSARL
jgi:hypothetical protein